MAHAWASSSLVSLQSDRDNFSCKHRAAVGIYRKLRQKWRDLAKRRHHDTSFEESQVYIASVTSRHAEEVYGVGCERAV